MKRGETDTFIYYEGNKWRVSVRKDHLLSTNIHLEQKKSDLMGQPQWLHRTRILGPEEVKDMLYDIFFSSEKED